MTDIFLELIDRSIEASILVVAVVGIRILLRKAPKRFRMFLWALVAIKLMCPVTLESSFSLVPRTEVGRMQVKSNAGANLDEMISPSMKEVSSVIGNSSNIAALGVVEGATFVWCVGIIGLVTYFIVSFTKMKRKVACSIPWKDNVWICDEINSAFILGVLRPKIYLPSSMSDTQFEYVIRHEKSHLAKLDHVWKVIGFLLLSVYWFQPFVWIGYLLFCKDMEFACDERVIRHMDLSDRKEYSKTLLSLSVRDYKLAACPLGFGEVGVKGRIKQVLHYKKPVVWINILAGIILIVAAVCLLTNQKSESKAIDKNEVRMETPIPEIKATPKNEKTEHKNLKEVKAYLSKLSSDSETLAKQGCLVNTLNEVKGVKAWNAFSMALTEGEAAEIVIVQYTTEGDPIFDYLSYDGKRIYHVQDVSRDHFGGSTKYYEETFTYLKVFEDKDMDGYKIKYIVLTDKKDLTYQEYAKMMEDENYNWEDGVVSEVAALRDGSQIMKVK